jgi:hypothetical protein
MLVAELDHRVKNVLARVGVVAMYTREGSGTIDEFIEALDRRIQSMAVAHELLSQRNWLGVRLADLVRHQLAPYATDANTATSGPDILLNGKPIFLRGISIHEEAPLRGGRAFSEEDARTLLTWAKELGCNFVRLAHYPHNEHITRMAGNRSR